MNVHDQASTQQVLDSIKTATSVELLRFARSSFPLIAGLIEEISEAERRGFLAFLVASQWSAVSILGAFDWTLEAVAKGPMAGHEKAEPARNGSSPQDYIRPMRWVFTSKARTVDEAVAALLEQGKAKGLDAWSNESVVRARVLGYLSGCKEGRYDLVPQVNDDGSTLLVDPDTLERGKQ